MANENRIISTQDVQRILSIVKKNWWICLVVVSIAYAVGNFYSYKLPNIYAAKSQLILGTNDEYKQSSVLSDEGSFYGNTYKTFIDNSNETRIISSYDMIAKAIDKLNFDVSYFLVGRIKTEEVFSGIPFTLIVKSLNNLLYEQQIHFKILDANTFQITYTENGIDKLLKGTFGQGVVNEDMDLMVTKNKSFSLNSVSVLKVADYLVQIHKKGTLVQKYQQALTVENPDYTNVLQLEVKDEIAERAKMFIDTLEKVYIDNSVQTRIDVNTRTLYYINLEIEQVNRILDDYEDTMQNYLENDTILNLDEEGKTYFQQYVDFDSRKKGYLMRISALLDLQRYIIEEKDSSFLPASVNVISDDPFISTSTEALYKLKNTEAEVLGSVTVNNFGARLYRARIDSLKSNFLTYIKNDTAAIRKLIDNIDKQSQSTLQKINLIPGKARGLQNINRKVGVNEKIYLFLLQQRANNVIAKAGIVSNSKVIEEARSEGVVSPDRHKINYAFMGGGFLLSLLLIFVRIMYFERIESVAELKNATTLPVIGEIVYSPVIKELSVVVEHEPKSPIAESFRTIRTNLQYMIPETTGGRVIVVTSNSPGEGKTFTSLNLSTILAKGGRRVILLELDLHKPKVQKGLNMTSEIGISSIMIGKSTIEESILETQIENLSVILSGPLPPNPSEIVVNKKMAEILDYCREHFDFVVVDTPPVGLISDALVLMKHSDVNLFVLNSRVSYRPVINSLHEIAQMSDVNNFGLILNGIKRKKSRYYYYNRYSYGGYGGYGGYGSYGYGNYGYGTSKSPKPRPGASGRKNKS